MIDEKIKESINSVKESLKELENQLEEGKLVQTRLNFGGTQTGLQKVNLSFEKPPPQKKRVTKAAAKADALVEKSSADDTVTQEFTENQQKSKGQVKMRGGPWGVDEEQKFIEAVKTYGKDWNKI